MTTTASNVRSLLYALLAAGCADGGVASTTRSIVNGTPATGDPAVVELRVGCTGSLIAPRVVLTAKHCLEGVALSDLAAFFGNDIQGPGTTIQAVDSQMHATADIGVVLLASDGPAEPLPVFGGDLAVHVGEDVRIVGFGTTSESGPDEFGLKRQGMSLLAGVEGEIMYIAETGGSWTCYGDSGGPNFMRFAGVEHVVGVVSYGTAACGEPMDAQVRTDVYYDWIMQFVGDAPPPPQPDPDDDADAGAGGGAPDAGGAPEDPGHDMSAGGCQVSRTGAGAGASRLGLLALLFALTCLRARSARRLALAALIMAGGCASAGSDQRQVNVCTGPDFACDDGACIADQQVCDGTPDCAAGEDESDVTCGGGGGGTCSGVEFACLDGTCLPGSLVCNGTNDCAAGEDEADTVCGSDPPPPPPPTDMCAADQFPCPDGACVPGAQVCDGTPSCADGADEAPEPCGGGGGGGTCTPDQFPCSDGSGCVVAEWVCDMISDCADNSDEAEALCAGGDGGGMCPADQFSCTDGSGCVVAEWVCDTIPDCADASDEATCP